MDAPPALRFPLGRQSSYAHLDTLDSLSPSPSPPSDQFLTPRFPHLTLLELTDGSSDGEKDSPTTTTTNAPDDDEEIIEIPASVKLMYAAHEGDLDGIKELIDSFGANVDFRDIDNRTPLHVAACQGYIDVVKFLVEVVAAEVDPKDRWGSTPLADAIYYKNFEVAKLLEAHGAKPPMAPMHVKDLLDVPEYEIDPKEIDFSKSVNINKGTFHRASWRGIEVAVKKLGDEVFTDEEKLNAFRNELALLQRIRHPNVVQFLGAVTQSTPMMIVTEFLPKGDVYEYLQLNGALKPRTAVRYALDIARGMSYLHEIKPDPVIHCDLEPSNILRDDSGHLKVADFGVSKLLKVAKEITEDCPVTTEKTSCRYMAPELFRNEVCDTKVDVFSFALIVHEMIEGCPPFSSMDEKDVQQAYADNERPPFKVPSKLYPHGLKELISECWREDPAMRPTFRQIIGKLDHLYNNIGRKRRWIKVKPLKCFQRTESSLGSHGSSSYARGI